MRVVIAPFRNAASAVSFPVKLISDTRTAAPSITHGSSDQASKIRAFSTIRSSTARLLPPRIELVATRPARTVRLCPTKSPVLWNQ